jgi:LuxR family maltose regulon positive regulatory protein
MSLDNLLVSTKFAPPRVGSRYITRNHLLDALQRGKHCKLALVTGSAGFGKTILLAQWRQQLLKAGQQVSWLSLSHDERLLPNFCAHLFDALQRLGIPLEDEVLLAGEGIASIDSIVAGVVNGLATIDDDLYLVLDDYHHVEDPLAHSLVQKLLDHGPGNLHLIITSRAVPPLSIARLRVMGQVAEVECGDLPFDLAETRSFLEQNVSSLRFTADEISEIHYVTHGWPASLQLLAITLRSRPESRSTLHNLALHSANLQNYLSEDVLARLSTDLAQFMESISICRRFNAALAAAVTANADAASLLRQIEDENLLIMRTESDDRSPWYRFHPLFAEFLMVRLERRGAAEVNALHRRAGLWFAEKGLVVEALRHSALGNDVASAVAIIERSAPTAWHLNYVGPSLHLANNLSPEDIVSHPRLLYLGALTLAMTGRHTKAAAWIEQMQAADPVNTRETAFRVALTSALSAFQQDDAARAIELLEPLKSRDAKSAFERHVFVSTLAPALASAGRYAEAHQLLDAHPVAPDDPNDTALLMAGCRTVVLLIEGKVADAERTSTYARVLEMYGRRSIWTGMCAAVVASVYYEQDRIDDARELLANQLHLLGTSSAEIIIRAVTCQARLDLLLDSTDTALALLDRHASVLRSNGLNRPFVYLSAEQARIFIAKKDLERAAAIVARLEKVAESVADTSGFRAEIPAVAALARARLELASGNHEDALHAVARAQQIADRLGRGAMIVTGHMIAAMILHAADRTTEAASRLALAVSIASRLGLVRTFLDESEQIRRQLDELRNDPRLDGDAALYVDKLLGHFAGQRTLDAGGPEAAAKASLTPRELEMVDLIAAGMSNKRIANTLNITLETVKWNLKNVFIKLGVSSRYDAMTRARQYGLIK